ncbi:MAG: hypothetical protein KC636_28560 [Myxococcales bacterium]|nr:hypothetical protein [Myxococcales bacterium]
MPADAKQLAARLVAELCVEEATRPERLGVLAENLPPLKPDAFAARLKSALNGREARLAVLGTTERLKRSRWSWIETTTDPQAANAWRNDARARAGVPTIVLVLGPAAKLSSLRTAYPLIGTREVRAAAVDAAIKRRATPERRSFWRAVAAAPGDFPLSKVLYVVAQLEQLSDAALHDAEPTLASALGLLPTKRLFNQAGLQLATLELRRNLELVHKVRELGDRERRRLSALAEDNAKDREVVTAILRYVGRRRDEDLRPLTYEGVKEALRYRPKATRAPVDDDDDDAEGERADATLDADAIIGEELVFGDRDIEDVADELDRHIREVEEDGEPELLDFDGRKILSKPRPGTTEATGLFAALLSEASWGGIVMADDDVGFMDALKRAADGEVEVHPFKPASEDGIQTTLTRAVDMGYAPASALARWERYARARAALLEHAEELVDRPLVALVRSKALQAAAREAVDAYGEALSAVHEVAEALASRSSLERSRTLYAQAICLDVVFFFTDAGKRAVMAPLHPFHLWRSVALLEILRVCREDLEALGKEEVGKLLEDAPTHAPNLVLSPLAAAAAGIQRPLYFIGTETLGSLPLYVEPTARSLGRFRSRELPKIAGHFLRLSPHAALGLRVVLVDPPSLVGILSNLVKIRSPLSEGGVPLHVRVIHTRPPEGDTERDDEEGANLAREIRDSNGSLTVDVVARLEAVDDLLKSDPAHLTIVFEPGRAEELRVGITAPPTLSPLSAPRYYRYDEFDDRLDVIVAGDVAPLARLHEFYCRVLDIPKTTFTGRRSGISQSTRTLEKLARRSMWLTVVDQGVEPTVRLGGAARIHWRAEAGRDIVTFTAFTETIDDLITEVARLAGLPPEEETVQALKAQLFGISGEAVLALASNSVGHGLANPRIAVATVGVAAAARWYSALHPGALLLSIDDSASRRWILGHNADNRRADLFALRATPTGVAVDVMEVKTRADGDAPLFEQDGVAEGRATTQIDQSIKIFRDLLTPNHSSPVMRARADILRDQLYRAVASREYDCQTRARLVKMLEALFADGSPEISGLIFLVEIDPTSPQSPSAPKPAHSPEGNNVGIIRLTEAGARRRPPSTPAEPPSDDTAEAPAKSPAKGRKRGQKREAKREPEATSERPRVLIGTTSSNSEVYWDPHHPERRLNNFGVLVTGDSGMGKTQIIQAIIAETAKHDLPICVLDFKNDFSTEDFCAGAKLVRHDVNRDGLPFNPFALVPDERGECQAIRQAHEIGSILRRVFRLGDQQEARLKKAIERAYLDVGIEPKEWRKVKDGDPAPSLDDVIALLRAKKGNDALLNRLGALADLELLPDNDRAALSFERLLASRLTLDLFGLPDDRIKEALAEFLIVRLHSYMLRGEQPRRLRRLLVLDEAWRVKDSARLQELSREGRAFGVGIVIGTQFPEDIPDTLSGNLATRLYLKNQNDEHRRAVLRALCGSTTNDAAKSYRKKLMDLKELEGFFQNLQYTPPVLLETLPYYQRVEAAKSSG